MNWNSAVIAMKSGYSVRRVSDNYKKIIHQSDGGTVQHLGTEGCKLSYAWTVDEKPVQIYTGSTSNCLFVPDDYDRTSVDWEIE